jgi:hypothetical protein
MNTDQIINWLNIEATRIQNYHDHKENMAWVATVLYITGAITTAFYFNTITVSTDKIIAIILLMFVSIGAVSFVNWQFRNRWKAAIKVECLIRTTAKLLKNPEKQIPEDKWEIDDDLILPAFVLESMDSTRKRRIGIGIYFFSEIISYAIMLVAAIVFIILIIG